MDEIKRPNAPAGGAFGRVRAGSSAPQPVMHTDVGHRWPALSDLSTQLGEL